MPLIAEQTTLSLASLFSDRMVLQRDKRLPVWGDAPPHAEVSVRFAGHEVRTQTDADGRWSLALPPLEASATGRTFEVTAACADGVTMRVALSDVLVGEVWLCSGQSNMEWAVNQSDRATVEIAAADYPTIRLFTVPKRVSDVPEARLAFGQWETCSPQTVATFSAVGYFFGRELSRQLGVPIGLVHSSWGGTVAEAWVSRDGLTAHVDVAELWHAFERQLPHLDVLTQQWREQVALIEQRTRDTGNEGVACGWAGVDPSVDEAWPQMNLPCLWQAAGLDFSGVVWFRRSVDIPEAWAGKPITLSLGAADKSDVTYFNGRQVGSLTMADRPDAWAVNRRYDVPGELVRAGRNVIAVRVHSNCFGAGLHGPRDLMQLHCPSVPGSATIALDGAWRYAVEANYGQVDVPPQPMGRDNQNSPTFLHNGMIHALAPYAMRGVIWYQGESNVGRAAQYRALLPVLIEDLRRCWGDSELAFHLVQLANYLPRRDEPGESDWALLREAQALALRLPHTGMAVAIDIGESHDIHPRNKQDVGLRLAHSALHLTYGRTQTPPCGPRMRDVVARNGSIRIAFDHAWGGLTARDERVTGFAIAGDDGRFVWADAAIDGDAVVVSSPRVPQPRHVRYAWADNPDCNLYNGAGLPTAPFRTDADGSGPRTI
jgi:sialate O-acetylesterase